MKWTPEKLERLAVRGEPMPDGLRLYQQAFYQAMRSLYSLYHRKGISKEDASAEKKLILAEYSRAEGDFEANRRGILNHAKMWKEIERAANQFGRERTLENAEAFVEAVYGCRLKEVPNA